MTNPTTSEVLPEVLDENRVSINSFLKQSYSQAKKQLEGGVNLIQGGVTFIKDEFSAFYHETGHYLNKMVLPVNNFLKDHSQIENELQQEINRESAQLVFLSGNMVPLDQALTSEFMEENY
ncbi:MAG: hypothetical protein ABJA85_00680 [Bacteroidota bacterium]